MEEYKFIDNVYKYFGHRAINSLYNKCREVMEIISMGFKIRDFQNNEIKYFTNIDQELVKKLQSVIFLCLILVPQEKKLYFNTIIYFNITDIKSKIKILCFFDV